MRHELRGLIGDVVMDALKLTIGNKLQRDLRCKEKSRGYCRLTGFLGREVLVQRWREDLESPVAGIWTVEGIRPHLERWLKRRHGALSYRLVQVLTGHGCF
ncbi:jg4728, partial [Pararge aegeria aegeria]